MPLFNLKKSYEMKAKCYNCGTKFIIKIPHGIKAKEYLDTDKCRCVNCYTDDIGIDIPNRRKLKNGIQEEEVKERRGVWSRR